MNDKLKFNFYGGAGTVTGANFLIEVQGLKILLDCGVMQGETIEDRTNRSPFPYNPEEINYLFVSHAHLDHVGLIPRLVREGFRGKIFSTPPTKDITEALLIDSLGVLRKEAKAEDKPALYTEEEVENAMKLWETIPYRQGIKLKDDLTITFRDSGHIIGSAMFEIFHAGKKILYTGDLGNSPSPLLNDTEMVTDVDYLILESVYGDRNHASHKESKEALEDIIEDTMNSGGTLMLPAFSIEKTQEILFEIKEMMIQGRIPLVRVYLDSPLAIKVTDIYRKYVDYLNPEAQKIFSKTKNGEIFSFPQLVQTLATEESVSIKDYHHPKIIIAGSGMSTGGRILHHEKNYLGDPRSTLLLTGYQSTRTLGRILQEGARTVKIMGDTVNVNARVVTLSGYSAHKGSDDLLNFVNATSDKLKKVFVVLGEPKSSLFLVQRIRDNLAIDAVAPAYREFHLLS
ncbi:MAG TPA: MBL fold metallo-hydrolase [Candidatus Paceibacterota bacterium]|nr:MBL fold metallo-hydrolase [Candidatus Paceibacterota bacterium]